MLRRRRTGLSPALVEEYSDKKVCGLEDLLPRTREKYQRYQKMVGALPIYSIIYLLYRVNAPGIFYHQRKKSIFGQKIATLLFLLHLYCHFLTFPILAIIWLV